MKDKAGCLIKALVVSTILIAGLVYFAINYGPGLVKDFVSGMIIDDLRDHTAFMPESPQKDSLIAYVETTIDTFSLEGVEINTKKVNQFFDSLDTYTADTVLSQHELESLIYLLKNEVFHYE